MSIIVFAIANHFQKSLILKMNKYHLVLATIFAFSMIHLPLGAFAGGAHRLRAKYYRDKCPQVETVIARTVALAFARNPNVAAGLIRLFFHDCFIQGCDASILLDYTPSSEPVEKISPANDKTIKGLDVIDEIKAQLEQECPETVSCADILTYATREAVFLSGLPHYSVQGGRRDGFTSRASDVIGNLPFPTMSVDAMIQLYASKGFTVEDMVVLAGAHSIGNLHCRMFDYRLYLNLTNTNIPPMDPAYAAYLKTKCPSPSLGTADKRDDAIVKFDPASPFTLDNMYYINLLRGRGLLQSDQVMVSDPRTRRIVLNMAFNPVEWSKKFAQAMIKMGTLDVLTGNKGEIRRNCRVFN